MSGVGKEQERGDRRVIFGLRKKTRSRVVLVSFRELTSDTPADASDAYAYRWELPTEPEIGARVWVPGAGDRPATAIVAAVDASVPELKVTTRLVTQQELSEAQAKAAADRVKVAADRDAWLDMARRAAGLSTTGRARKSPPVGFDSIPPADGTASANQAEEFGRVWWRAFKQAAIAGRPSEEVDAYKAIARRWYAIRDKG
jgi:hypothetical protein